jgi:hypothetical protein
MASIIPFGQQTVGNATVTLMSFFTAVEFNTTYPDSIHKLYVQADPGNTVQVDVKYAGKVVCTLWKPAATGELPEHFLTCDENIANAVDPSQITFTSTDAGSKVNGYVTQT